MQYTFTRHQILNITTGILYTPIEDIYEFFDKVISEGIMTHMLPRAADAIRPIMAEILPDIPGKGYGYKPDSDNSEITFEFTDEHRQKFWKNYEELPSLLD